MYLEKIKKDLKKASDILALCNTSQKNEALLKVASSISKDFDKILSANEKDVINAEKSGMKANKTRYCGFEDGKADTVTRQKETCTPIFLKLMAIRLSPPWGRRSSPSVSGSAH